jgi:hypothetical protein
MASDRVTFAAEVPAFELYTARNRIVYISRLPRRTLLALGIESCLNSPESGSVAYYAHSPQVCISRGRCPSATHAHSLNTREGQEQAPIEPG